MLDNKDLAMIAELMKDTFSGITDEIHKSSTSLDNKITSIQMTIENEIRRNIDIIAENHIGLNKKLDEVLSRDEERELMKIKLNVLENEIRKLKEQLEKIA